VFLKDIGRIQGLLAVYFFVCWLQTLLERETPSAPWHAKNWNPCPSIPKTDPARDTP